MGRLPIALAAALGLAGIARGQEIPPGIEIAGKVVDAAGNPVARADVAHFWLFRGEQVVPVEGTQTGDDGTFRLTVHTWGRPWAVTALDAERRRAAFFGGGPAAPSRPVVLSLAPAVRVHGVLTCKALGQRPEWTNVYVWTKDRAQRIAQCGSTDTRFSLVIPAGDWQAQLLGSDAKDRFVPLAAEAGKEVDLGTQDLELSFLAKRYGKPLPAWTVTAARGARKDVQISDYRGKWVLVAFWDGACASDILPRLLRLCEAFATERDKFEVLAFHDSTAQEFEAFDREMEIQKEHGWTGGALPFPVLLDAGGKTIEEWGIVALPTLLLVDPAGNLVRRGDDRTLSQRLMESRPGVARRVQALSGSLESALHAMEVLGPRDGDEGLAALAVLLRDCKEPRLADAALDAMGRIGGEPGEMGLYEMGLQSEDPARQERAAAILGRMLRSDQLPTLLEIAERPGSSAGLARAACDALAARCDEDSRLRSVLEVATRSSNEALKAAAIAALARVDKAER